jgi:hypothetical protein
MSKALQLRMARASQEQLDTLRKWFQELEAMLEDEKSDMHDIGQFVSKTYEARRIDEYERILMGYETMIENACDQSLTYLDFKPEIKAAMQNYSKSDGLK